jgi:hypothetical protein
VVHRRRERYGLTSVSSAAQAQGGADESRAKRGNGTGSGVGGASETGTVRADECQQCGAGTTSGANESRAGGTSSEEGGTCGCWAWVSSGRTSCAGECEEEQAQGAGRMGREQVERQPGRVAGGGLGTGASVRVRCPPQRVERVTVGDGCERAHVGGGGGNRHSQRTIVLHDGGTACVGGGEGEARGLCVSDGQQGGTGCRALVRGAGGRLLGTELPSLRGVVLKRTTALVTHAARHSRAPRLSQPTAAAAAAAHLRGPAARSRA